MWRIWKMVFLPFSFSCFFFSISLLVDKCCCCWVASVVSDSVQPRRWQPTRLCCPWDSPGKNTGVGCHFLYQCMKVKTESEVTQLCPTPSDPMDCSLPGSSVHRIFQAKSSVYSFGKCCHFNWRRQWHPTPLLLPGKSYGRRSLVGCSPWGREE